MNQFILENQERRSGFRRGWESFLPRKAFCERLEWFQTASWQNEPAQGEDFMDGFP